MKLISAHMSLLSDYAKSTRRYPVVYVTDAPYAFPRIRAIAGRVILGRPSLWFDKGQPFRALRQFAHTHGSLSGKVRFYVGGLEPPTRARRDDENMVALLQR